MLLLGLREIGGRVLARGGLHTQKRHPTLRLRYRRGLLPIGRSNLRQKDGRQQGALTFGLEFRVAFHPVRVSFVAGL